MHIEYDEAKRAVTLEQRGLDFADAGAVLAGANITFPDLRHSYGEERFNTVGLLHGRMVVVTWTPRGAARRIISMRKANEREQTRYHPLG